MSTRFRSPLWWTGLVLASTGFVAALAVLELVGSSWSVVARFAIHVLGATAVVTGIFCVFRAEVSMRKKCNELAPDERGT